MNTLIMHRIMQVLLVVTIGTTYLCASQSKKDAQLAYNKRYKELVHKDMSSLNIPQLKRHIGDLQQLQKDAVKYSFNDPGRVTLTSMLQAAQNLLRVKNDSNRFLEMQLKRSEMQQGKNERDLAEVRAEKDLRIAQAQAKIAGVQQELASVSEAHQGATQSEQEKQREIVALRTQVSELKEAVGALEGAKGGFENLSRAQQEKLAALEEERQRIGRELEQMRVTFSLQKEQSQAEIDRNRGEIQRLTEAMAIYAADFASLRGQMGDLEDERDRLLESSRRLAPAEELSQRERRGSSSAGLGGGATSLPAEPVSPPMAGAAGGGSLGSRRESRVDDVRSEEEIAEWMREDFVLAGKELRAEAAKQAQVSAGRLQLPEGRITIPALSVKPAAAAAASSKPAVAVKDLSKEEVLALPYSNFQQAQITAALADIKKHDIPASINALYDFFISPQGREKFTDKHVRDLFNEDAKNELLYCWKTLVSVVSSLQEQFLAAYRLEYGVFGYQEKDKTFYIGLKDLNSLLAQRSSLSTMLFGKGTQFPEEAYQGLSRFVTANLIQKFLNLLPTQGLDKRFNLVQFIASAFEKERVNLPGGDVDNALTENGRKDQDLAVDANRRLYPAVIRDVYEIDRREEISDILANRIRPIKSGMIKTPINDYVQACVKLVSGLHKTKLQLEEKIFAGKKGDIVTSLEDIQDGIGRVLSIIHFMDALPQARLNFNVVVNGYVAQHKKQVAASQVAAKSPVLSSAAKPVPAVPSSSSSSSSGAGGAKPVLAAKSPPAGTSVASSQRGEGKEEVVEEWVFVPEEERGGPSLSSPVGTGAKGASSSSSGAAGSKIPTEDEFFAHIDTQLKDINESTIVAMDKVKLEAVSRTLIDLEAYYQRNQHVAAQRGRKEVLLEKIQKFQQLVRARFARLEAEERLFPSFFDFASM